MNKSNDDIIVNKLSRHHRGGGGGGAHHKIILTKYHHQFHTIVPWACLAQFSLNNVHKRGGTWREYPLSPRNPSIKYMHVKCVMGFN